MGFEQLHCGPEVDKEFRPVAIKRGVRFCAGLNKQPLARISLLLVQVELTDDGYPV